MGEPLAEHRGAVVSALLPLGTWVLVRGRTGRVAAWGAQDHWQVPLTMDDGAAVTWLRRDCVVLLWPDDPLGLL